MADLIVDTLRDSDQIDAAFVEIVDLLPVLTGALDREQVDAVTAEALAAVENTDIVIAAAPVLRGSYPGLFKHFFDPVDQYALANTPVILAATGGSDRHALVLDHALRPLFAFFQAWTSPVGIYLSAGDFDGTTILNPEVFERIEMAAADVLPVARMLADRASVAATILLPLQAYCSSAPSSH